MGLLTSLASDEEDELAAEFAAAADLALPTPTKKDAKE